MKMKIDHENNINSPLIIIGGNSSNKGEEWSTIFDVYALVSLQLLLAISFGTNVVLNSGISRFANLHTTHGLIFCIISFILWLVDILIVAVQWPLVTFSNHYPWNHVLFTLWSILFASTIGLSCSYFEGNGITILETIILMSVITVSLTIYALCGTIGDFGFNLCQPCFLTIFLVVCLHISIQIFHDQSTNLGISIYALLVAFLFCAHTYIAGNQIVKDYDSDIGTPFSAVLYSYWAVLYYIYLKLSPSR